MRRITIRLAPLALGAALLAGCGGEARQQAEPGASAPHRAAPLGAAAPRAAAPRHACDAARSLEPGPTHSFAALVRSATELRSEPGGGRVLARVSRRDVNGYRTVLGIVGARAATGGCRVAAYRVELPVPPNRRTGWVSARAVSVFRVRSRVLVDLSARRLVAYRDGRPALRAPVAVGAPATPTPVGRYFVDERWLLDDPNGVFGVAALGISAHSEVLTDWVQGGPIALHGTNEPGLVGEAISHGCVRLRNEDMRRLLRLAPAGTPVWIRR